MLFVLLCNTVKMDYGCEDVSGSVKWSTSGDKSLGVDKWKQVSIEAAKFLKNPSLIVKVAQNSISHSDSADFLQFRLLE